MRAHAHLFERDAGAGDVGVGAVVDARVDPDGLPRHVTALVDAELGVHFARHAAAAAELRALLPQHRCLCKRKRLQQFED